MLSLVPEPLESATKAVSEPRIPVGNEALLPTEKLGAPTYRESSVPPVLVVVLEVEFGESLTKLAV